MSSPKRIIRRLSEKEKKKEKITPAEQLENLNYTETQKELKSITNQFRRVSDLYNNDKRIAESFITLSKIVENGEISLKDAKIIFSDPTYFDRLITFTKLMTKIKILDDKISRTEPHPPKKKRESTIK